MSRSHPNASPSPSPQAEPVRFLDGHQTNACNRVIGIGVFDQPGPGGASSVYGIAVPGPKPGDDAYVTMLRFQNGPVGPNGEGVNGITFEALLEVMMDRMMGFQNGPWSCAENAHALDAMQTAVHWLKERSRTRDVTS